MQRGHLKRTSLTLLSVLVLSGWALSGTAQAQIGVDPTTGPAPDTVVDPTTGPPAQVVDPDDTGETDQAEPGDSEAPTVEPGATDAPTTLPSGTPPEATSGPSQAVPPPAAAVATTTQDTPVADASAVPQSSEESLEATRTDVCRPTQLPATMGQVVRVHQVTDLRSYTDRIRIEWDPSTHSQFPRDMEYARVEYRVGDGEWVILEEEVPRGTRRADLDDAELDTDYTFRVTSVSYAVDGERTESEPVEAGPYSLRSLPPVIGVPLDLAQNRSLTDHQGTITVRWSPSGDDGARTFAVEAYHVTVREEGAGEWGDGGVVTATHDGEPYTFTLREPDLDKAYEFRVEAVSAGQNGETVVSVAVTTDALVVPALPEALNAPGSFNQTTTPEDLAGFIGLGWTLSPDDGGGEYAVAQYEIQVREAEGPWTYFSTALAGTDSALYPHAVAGVEYGFRIRSTSASDPRNQDWAVTALGDDPFLATRVHSPWVELTEAMRREAPLALGAPASLEAEDVDEPYGGSIQLSWAPSADDGGGTEAVAAYDVEVRAGDDEWTRLEPVSAGEHAFTYAEAKRDTAYTFRVRASTVPLPLGPVVSAWVESEPVTAQDAVVSDEGFASLLPTSVEVADVAWDGGGFATISWEIPSEHEAPCGLGGFILLAQAGEDGFWTPLEGFITWEQIEAARIEPEDRLEVDANHVTVTVRDLDASADYAFRVGVVASHLVEAPFAQPAAWTEPTATISPAVNWFNGQKSWVFIVGCVVCGFVLFFIRSARKGKQLFIRKMAGLDAVDEAIGRATEMGRPILYVPGIMDLDNVQTLAGLTILGHTSKMVAEYDTEINVPVARSLVLTAGREVIKQSYLEAGRPDAYNENMVHYLTDAQFGYVAGVNGIIVRDEPATCFYMGAFYAESLILAETGNAAGAIQIAGTAMPSQLPFFVAACDYTLIGEELFAASAYLSKDPKQLGSLKGQDMGKLIAMIAILLGSLMATLGVDPVVEFLHMVFGS